MNASLKGHETIDGFEMVLIHNGTFMMGSDHTLSDSEECLLHQVTLTRDYYIGKYPVTQREWQAVMGNNPSEYTGDDRRPVENVSWLDVQNFIAELNRRTGKNFRLPSEAEWEYAAKGADSSQGFLYAGTDEPDDVAWHRSNSVVGTNTQTHPVGTKAPNEIGIYDMCGNVAEWVADRDGVFTDSPKVDPTGPERLANAAFDIYMTRGSHHDANRLDCRTTLRECKEASIRESTIGFRLALTSAVQSPQKPRVVPPLKKDVSSGDAAAEIKSLQDQVEEQLKISYAALGLPNFVRDTAIKNYRTIGKDKDVDFWRKILEKETKEAQEAVAKSAKKAAAAATPEAKAAASAANTEIETIKTEVRALLNKTYNGNAELINMMMSTFERAPQANTLHHWQLMRAQTGGAPAPAAPGRPTESGDWEYESAPAGNGIMLTRHKNFKSLNELVLPAELDGRPVTHIGKNSFNRGEYRTIIIPSSVIDIGEMAFVDCKFVRHITIPDSVEIIGYRAFSNCGLITLELGKRVKSIGQWAFSDNALTTLVIPDNVTELIDSAFEGNPLTSLTIGSGLKIIPPRAFLNSKLTMVSLPANVTHVGRRAFDLPRGTYIVTAGQEITTEDSAFRDARIISAAEAEKLIAQEKKAAAVVDTRLSVTVDEKNKVIDLSDKNPPAYGRGWLFRDNIYTIVSYADVTITGSTNDRRIFVPERAKMVNITFDNVTINSKAPSTAGKSVKSKTVNEHTPLIFRSSVTLNLKGKNSVTTDTKAWAEQGRSRNFTRPGVAISCNDLTVHGDGSLDILGIIQMENTKDGSQSASDFRLTDFVQHSGTINMVCGMIIGSSTEDKGGSMTINGGELNFVVRNDKEFAQMGIRGKTIVINGGKVDILSHALHGKPLCGETVTINGGTVTVEDASWTANNCPPNDPAIFAKGRKDSSTHEIEVEARVTINGGTVTAIVPNTSVAPAIGNLGGSDSIREGDTMLGTFYQNGGVLFASQLTGKKTGEWIPAGTCLNNITGGILFEKNQGTFYGNNVDIVSDVSIDSPQTLKVPKNATVTVYKGVNFSAGNRVSASQIKNVGTPPPCPPPFVPEIFAYADEHADYKLIDGFEMMRVKAGTFMMGATADQGWEVERNEKPAHQVTLTRDYFIGLYPVTQKQWVDIMGSNPATMQRNDYSLDDQILWSAVLGAPLSRFSGTDFYPIESITSLEMLEFINRLNQKTGKNFRLPTEAEWEFAARGGVNSRGFMYAGSNTLSDVTVVKSFNAQAMPTATKGCNELGLYDMSGNVGEMINDFYSEYTESHKTDPTGPDTPADPPDRIVRGNGSSYAKAGRVAWRRDYRIDRKAQNIGFRLVLSE